VIVGGSTKVVLVVLVVLMALVVLSGRTEIDGPAAVGEGIVPHSVSEAWRLPLAAGSVQTGPPLLFSGMNPLYTTLGGPSGSSCTVNLG
jgi:hypothetical protein